MFEPVAIVGRGTVLPGAFTPDLLWKAIQAGRDLLTEVPEGLWPLPVTQIHRANETAPSIEKRAPFRGGYVDDSELGFDATLFDIGGGVVETIDRSTKWLLHAGRSARNEMRSTSAAPDRTAVIVGNLGYPTATATELSYRLAFARDDTHGITKLARERFSSGRPATLLANSLSAAGPAFCLDASCASSLYAVKFACDLLHEDSADVVFVGAVNGCYNMLLHTGFSELNALSPSGRSRPFHRRADGLIPSEGAAVIALKRLSDALDCGDEIFAIVRGVGLSNDGQQRGILSPNKDGQVRALQQAYSLSGLDPLSVGYLECHATGTITGDRTELETLRDVFDGHFDLPVGSLKSNIGHLITVAGLAGILKMVGAFRANIRPATLHADDPIEALDEPPLRLLTVNEPWPQNLPKRAGLNNFGFGGNNAHLILEEFKPRDARAMVTRSRVVEKTKTRISKGEDRIVVCGLEQLTGDETNGEISDLELPISETVFPPNDLKKCLGQQTLALFLAQNVLKQIKVPAPERIAVSIGMGLDMEAVRACTFWYAERERQKGVFEDTLTPEMLKAALSPLEGPHCVLGAMPNLVANRANLQLDIKGYGVSISGEELSGTYALELGCRALRKGEVDLYLAGAVDLSSEEMHRLACDAVPELMRRRHKDGACVFALKRRSDAIRDGDTIFGEIEMMLASRNTAVPVREAGKSSDTNLGIAHCADGALGLAQIIKAGRTVSSSMKPAQEGVFEPFIPIAETFGAKSFTGWEQNCNLTLTSGRAEKPLSGAVPYLWYAAGKTREELIQALRSGTAVRNGSFRLAIVAHTEQELDKRRLLAERRLSETGSVHLPGVYYADETSYGELALVFPGLGSGYAEMCGDWHTAFPAVLADTAARLGFEMAPQFDEAIAALSNTAGLAQKAIASSVGSIFLAQAALEVLNLKPDAALGVSMGEAHMLAAFDVWERPQDILLGNTTDGFYEQLGGSAPAVAKSLGLAKTEILDWKDFDIFAPVEEVQQVVNGIKQVWITIIYSSRHCLLSGRRQACNEVLSLLEPCPIVLPRQHPLAFHGPFAEEYRQVFAKRHTIPTRLRDDVRFYFNAINDFAPISKETCSKHYVDQGFECVDFRRTVEKAWADGVRIFVETGPKSLLSNAISQTLGDRQHVSVSLNNPGNGTLFNFANVAAQLFVLGRDCNIEGLARRLTREKGETPSGQPRTFSVKTHLPPVRADLQVTAAPLEAKSDSSELTARTGSELIQAELPPSKKMEARKLEPAPAVDAPGYSSQESQICFRPQETRVMVAPPDVVWRQEPIEFGVSATNFSGNQPTDQALTSRISKPFTIYPSEQSFIGISRLSPDGPRLDRKDLELVASGNISDVLGEIFKQQDGYHRQCRVPRPPMLLVDRVTGMAGEAGSMGKGVCWTETDVTKDAWYLDDGFMPTGILIEAGQADLLLVSWLGVDFLNKSERVYRLLGCEITFHNRSMPKIGDTINYQIHIDSHANVGDTRMFFFRYDARIGDDLLISVRNGQAGFFSDKQLENSDGVRWLPEDEIPDAGARLDLPAAMTKKRSFDKAEVTAFAAGDLLSCFGEGFEMAAAHQKTPKIPSGRMQMIETIEEFDPAGGPWRRGYLCAACDVAVEAWFYDGHFQNDPCMPGTLMAEAAVQALEFYAAACGLTIDRDGYRFAPVAGEPFKFVCRGQVVPDAPHRITYEVFIEEIDCKGDQPVIYAALLVKSDGFKIFLCRRFGITLVRDWPLDGLCGEIQHTRDTSTISPSGEVRGDYYALLAAAWGKPSEAFGPVFSEADPQFDTTSNPPRLPGPPYHCMSRILSVNCPPTVETPGARMISEFDVDPHAWYFDDSGTDQMPLSVLSEVLLQPCGWFASYMGFALGKEVKFRNLDGKDAVLHASVTRETGTLRLETRFLKFDRVGLMALVFYEVICKAGDTLVMTLKTNFGFFPDDALANQKGLPTSTARMQVHQKDLQGPVDQCALDELHSTVGPVMPSGKLDLFDSVCAFKTDGGESDLGRLVGHHRIVPGAWYFKAHFFTDPVQPGSLGLEALFTLFKCLVRRKGLHKAFKSPVFQAPATGEVFSWRYRGQVVPINKEVLCEFELTEILQEETSVLIKGAGSLWVDGLRIYEVKDYALRICEQERKAVASAPLHDVKGKLSKERLTIDLKASPWLSGHKPSYVIPVFPILGVAGRIISSQSTQADRGPVSRLEDLEIRSWLALNKCPLRLEWERQDAGELEHVHFHRVENEVCDKKIVGNARILYSPFKSKPNAWPALKCGKLLKDPYSSGYLFHDGAFETAFDIRYSDRMSSFEFDIAACLERAEGELDILLDTLNHGFPHLVPSRWFGGPVVGMAAFPYRLEYIELFGPLPASGIGRVVTRKVDMPNPRQVRFEVQFSVQNTVAVEVRIVEALVPIDTIGKLSFSQLRKFCLFGAPLRSFTLSHRSTAATVLSLAQFNRANWLPGTYEEIYQIDHNADEMEKITQIAIKDHLRQKFDVHPSDIKQVGSAIHIAGHALIRADALNVNFSGEEVSVADA
ncbi:beta-ketoacyl synthase N-terminal-like domain-containing protein [Yoonia sp. R2-816]|uniref:beta-ketoacyl synthase N-terminal-like domain-containing protein n=1 Tax=Yoonia sp. R2-816 TaxID=3342638 RepID=UPI00372AE428